MSNHPYKAVLFDLYTALLDSWSLWNKYAESAEVGAAWRQEFLQLTYRTGAYRSYEGIITEAAATVGVTIARAEALIERWDEVEPWPETRHVLQALVPRVTLAVATNSSRKLADIAVARLGVPICVVATAEESGAYKPQPPTYLLALERLGYAANEVLFVAGSAADVPGATQVGMTVCWHNRIHQSPVADQIKPTYEWDSLLPLLELV